MSQLSVNTITNAAGGDTAQINGMTPTADSLQGFRNRIINGDMRIDQRNNGAAVTASGTFPVDRFKTFKDTASGTLTGQRSTIAPAGFINSLSYTITSAFTPSSGEGNSFTQPIEGFNIADLGWGTANAQTVTLSFWVRASVTGAYGGSLRNAAGNRSYPFTYTISVANTFEYKTIIVPGDTTGTWATNNATGLLCFFSLGTSSVLSGTAGDWAAGDFINVTGAINITSTAGATFFITGVQLEAGAVATPFERRPFGTELALCRRYCHVWSSEGTSFKFVGIGFTGTNSAQVQYRFPVVMRANPTVTFSEQNKFIIDGAFGNATTTVMSASFATNEQCRINATVASGITANQPTAIANNGDSGTRLITFNAEL